MNLHCKPSRFHLHQLLARHDAGEILDGRGRILKGHPAEVDDPKFSIRNREGVVREFAQSQLLQMRRAERKANAGKRLLSGNVMVGSGEHSVIQVHPLSPTDAGPLQDFSSNPYMVPAFSDDQGVQWERSDCYYIAPATSLAQLSPPTLWTIGKQTGKNEYRTRFSTMPSFPSTSGQYFTDVFNDDMLPVGQALLGDDGSKWMKCFERAYAYFRTGANLYGSTDWGWAAGTLIDWGIIPVTYSTFTPNLVTLAMSALSTSPCVVGSTYGDTGSTGIVPSHVYSIRAVDPVARTFLCDNPWKGFGPVVVTEDVFRTVFSGVTVGQTVTFPVDPTFTAFAEATPDPLAALRTSVGQVRSTLQGLLEQIAAHKAAHR
jgi:hypothetical protein